MGAARSAFSLIELLVVVAIVALLASILVPSLAQARAHAREATCATNLRTWGQAFHLYANDYNGALPHIDDRGRNSPPDVYDPDHPERECCYIDVLPPLIGRPAWRDTPQPNKPTGDIWQCPDARPRPDSDYDPDYQPSVMGYHSYAMNSYLEHVFRFGLPGPDWEKLKYPSFLQLNRCTAPTRTLLMFEQTLDPRQGHGQLGKLRMAGRFTAEDARALSERHAHVRGGLGGNVIMLDTHLEWRNDLWDETSREPRVPEPDDLTWYPYVKPELVEAKRQ